MTGRFISTHSIVLNLPLNIDRLPDRGASVRAQSAISSPGGGFVALSVVAAQGIPSCLAAPLGTGPNSFAVRQQMSDAGITSLLGELVGDIGVAVQLVESNGSITSVVAAGVESEPSREALEHLELHAGDIVQISGMDLAEPLGAEVLSHWGASLDPEVTLVLSVSPAVDEVELPVWRRLLQRADIVTMNIREAAALGRALASEQPGVSIRHVMRPDAAMVRRLGPLGCEVQESLDRSRVQIPAFDTVAADTTGVGDTHVGAMCGALMRGLGLVDACREANAASAVTVSHGSAFPVPTIEQIEQVLRDGRVTYSY